MDYLVVLARGVYRAGDSHFPMAVLVFTTPCIAGVILQRFVKCRGPKASITRVDWKIGRAPFAWCISNHVHFDDDNSEKDSSKRWITNIHNDRATSIYKVTGVWHAFSLSPPPYLAGRVDYILKSWLWMVGYRFLHPGTSENDKTYLPGLG